MLCCAVVKVGQDSAKSVKEDGSMPSPGEHPRNVKLGGEVGCQRWGGGSEPVFTVTLYFCREQYHSRYSKQHVDIGGLTVLEEFAIKKSSLFERCSRNSILKESCI